MAGDKKDPAVGNSPTVVDPTSGSVFPTSEPAAQQSLRPGAIPEGGIDRELHRHVQIGDVLNHIFEVKRFIARGGMGEVFEGINVNSDERVAIKVMLPSLASNANVLAMFRKEARTLTRLNHPALVQYRVLAQEPQLGVFYIVTDFVDGENLADMITRLDPSPQDLIELTRRLAEGLEAAHALGAIHRDIAPDNVMLEGGLLSGARIIDFGIAKDLTAGSATIIGDGFAGKLNYVAPEQLGDFNRSIGPWTDIYSLGLVILAVALRRDVPMGGTLVDAVDKRRAGPDLSQAPEILRPVLARMVRPNPEERPRSMREVLELLPPPGPAYPVKLSEPKTKPAKPPRPKVKKPAEHPDPMAVEPPPAPPPTPTENPEPVTVEPPAPPLPPPPTEHSEPAAVEPSPPPRTPTEHPEPVATEPPAPPPPPAEHPEPAAAEPPPPPPAESPPLVAEPISPAAPVARAGSDPAGDDVAADLPENARKSRKPLIVGGAAALALLLAAGLWFGGFADTDPPGTGLTDTKEAGRDNVPATRAALSSGLAAIGCSWLDVADVSQSGNDMAVALRGVASRPADVQAQTRTMLASRNLNVASIDVRDVAPIDASECASMDALRQIRDGQGGRMSLPQRQFEMTKLSSEGDSGTLEAKAVVNFHFGDPGLEMALFGVEPSGKISQLTSERAELIAGSEELGNNRYRLVIDVDHAGWSGLLLLTGKKPFDGSLLTGSPGSRGGDWPQRFLSVAQARGWKSEMVWFKVVDEQRD